MRQGFFSSKNELGDLPVLRGDTCSEVDDQHAEVGAADGLFRTDGGEDLDGIVALAARTEAGGIDESEVFSVERVGKINRIAGGSGDAGDDGALVLEDGFTSEDFPAFGRPIIASLMPTFSTTSMISASSVASGSRVSSILSMSSEKFRPCSAETKMVSANPRLGEIGEGRLVLVVIHLVEDEENVGFGFAQFLRQRLIDRGQALLRIDKEKDEIGGLHRDVRLDGDLLAEAVVQGWHRCRRYRSACRGVR